ncbi:MAG TPA: hypothetical protein VEQ18_03320 [Candidatus Nitrosocosmicus sp.]|nr:hypothetical protein [Candidatus Nitrosocosmicus sp.]
MLIPNIINPEIIETVETAITIFWTLGKITDRTPDLFAGLIIATTTNVILHHRKEDTKWIIPIRTCDS